MKHQQKLVSNKPVLSGASKVYSGPLPECTTKKMLFALARSPCHIQMNTRTFGNLNMENITSQTDVSIVLLKATIETNVLQQASEFLSTQPNKSYPIIVTGDENCLPRCGSLAVYGSEEFNLDIRLCIVKELLQNEDLYLSSKYLNCVGFSKVETSHIAYDSDFYHCDRTTVKFAVWNATK